MARPNQHERTLEPLEPRFLPVSPALAVIDLPAEQADFPQIDGSGVNVAVIDSGADLSQPYIKGSVNLLNPSLAPQDDFGHGSFVASEIHAVAPGAGIYAIKVLDSHGSGSLATIEAGVQWVIDHRVADGISVVNCSIGWQGDDPVIDREFEALAKAGVVVCVSAGNSQATYPNMLSAGADCPDVISVGATWADFLVNYTYNGATDFQTHPDKIAAYSQRSPKLGLLAPGDVTLGGDTWTGTSMSAALVSGASVLVHQALASQGKPTDEATILAVLQKTGKPIYDGDAAQDNVQHTYLTFPRLDIDAAIASIVPPVTQAKQPQPPTNATFVASLYEHVLSRAPDAEGLAYWLGLLGNGESRADVADRIWQSPEHRQHYASESPEQLYESLLGRQGDAGGLAYFAGKPEDFTAETMLASPEFFNTSANQ